MNRRALAIELTFAVLVPALAVGAGACGSSSKGPPVTGGPYEAGGPGTGGSSGAGGSGGSANDSGGQDAPRDVSNPKDGRGGDAVSEKPPPPPKDAGPDAPKAPCPGCTLLMAGVLNPQSLALDSGNVYWTQGKTSGGAPVAGSGSVLSVPRAGGPLNILYEVLTGPLVVKLVNPWIAWSESGASAGAGDVTAYNGGAGGMVATSLTSPFGIALDTSNAYYGSVAGGGVAIQSAPLAGGSVSTLGTVKGSLLPRGIAANGTSVYCAVYASGGGGGIFEVPLGGGTPTEVWTGGSKSQPFDVALDDTNVYWSDQGTGAVYSMPQAGGAVTTLAASSDGLVGPTFIAVDFTNVYVADPAGSALYEAPITGSGPKKLVTGVAVNAVAADNVDANVYFATSTQILSVAK